MSSVVDELPVSHRLSVISRANLSPKNSLLINEDDSSVELLIDRFESSNWEYGNSKSSFQFENKYFDVIFHITKQMNLVYF